MGYDDIIWNLYLYNSEDSGDISKIIDIIKKNSFFAITMPGSIAKKVCQKR